MKDYIERASVHSIIEQTSTFAFTRGGMHERVDSLPSADVAPVRHGRWLPQIVLGEKAWDCSECKTLGSPHWKWCPMCGCRMDEEEGR